MFLFCHCKKGDRLLDLLASADHTWLPMEILMERLGLSRRSVLYLMKKVNASLEAQGIPTIANQRGRGYFLPDESLCMLRTFETKPSAGNPLSEPKTLRLPFRELALQERDDMFRYIVITEPGVSLQAFMNIFHAARNTILQELRHLSSDSCSLHLSVTRHGRIILEDELVQRQWCSRRVKFAKLRRSKNANSGRLKFANLSQSKRANHKISTAQIGCSGYG